MTLAIDWQNGSGTPKRVTGGNFVRACDHSEIADEISRRMLLVYRGVDHFTDLIAAGRYVRAQTVGRGDLTRSLRDYVRRTLIDPQPYVLGGQPPSPQSMQWLWPEQDGDEGKIIVVRDPSPGQVSFFAKLNGTLDWTNPTLAPTAWIKAVHTNELRWACEHLCRGRWTVPLYSSAGLFSMVPDMPWFGGGVANNGTDELRSLGFTNMRTTDVPPRGLSDVTVRPSSCLQITADTDCTIALYRCLREIDFQDDLPTWNQHHPQAGQAWQQPGGLGGEDSIFIDQITLQANQPANLTGNALAAALQQMIDGQPLVFLCRRMDTSWQTIGFEATLTVDFDIRPY